MYAIITDVLKVLFTVNFTVLPYFFANLLMTGKTIAKRENKPLKYHPHPVSDI